jgi:very-short-patch-repair endonuclease
MADTPDDAPLILAATFIGPAQLAHRCISRHRRARMVEEGSLLRVRKGRYVDADAHPEIVRAARLGGRLDCVSLLVALGIFVWGDERFHLQIDAHAGRLPMRPAEVVAHWRHTAAARERLAVDLVEALAQAFRCQQARHAIASLESAWHLGLVDEADIADVFRLLPRRFRRLRGLLDRRSESGPETLMRLMLRGLGCTVELQVAIDGVGRVDFVVDGWLIVECDSRAHHEGWASQKSDRRRDLAAAAVGYTTVRPIARTSCTPRKPPSSP